MNADELRRQLEQYGELMVAVSEFEQPLELHLHDTEIAENLVRLQLTDGVVTFDVDEVSGAWYHTHSSEELGLE
jgi:dihydroxyacetone kinase-like predicted kinase